MTKTFEELPAISFYVHDVTNEAILIERGEMSYFPQYQMTKSDVDELNRLHGITRAQAEAMYAGALFGWDVAASDPKLYDEHGKFKIEHLCCG